MNYYKLFQHNPTQLGDNFVNSLNQIISFYEHPLHGDESPVIAVCHDLELAEETGFYELDDMLADHKEYEPKFIRKKLVIGNEE